MALQIPTFDNTSITFDTINFTFDGACLINGGASDVVLKGKIPSYTVSVPLNVSLASVVPPPRSFLPVTSPPQTYYINGVAVQSGGRTS